MSLHVVRSLIHTGDSMHDTDKAPDMTTQPNTPMPLETTPIGFQHPAGFEPVAFLIIGMSKSGQPFVNMPFTQPHLCLHLATLALAQASQLAVKALQEKAEDQSRILAPPPGLSIPPWAGPVGRG